MLALTEEPWHILFCDVAIPVWDRLHDMLWDEPFLLFLAGGSLFLQRGISGTEEIFFNKDGSPNSGKEATNKVIHSGEPFLASSAGLR